MPDEWMVRVEGREYGPVDLETLREWKNEGRLIRSNELCRIGEDRWVLAAEFPEIFADELPPAAPPDLIVRSPNVAGNFSRDDSHLSRRLLALS